MRIRTARVSRARSAIAGVTLLFGLLFGNAQLASAKERTHEVRSGETLSGIAAHYGVGVQRLCAANRMRKDAVLQVGKTLRIPGTQAPAPTPDATREVVVKEGDTLGGIAHRHGTTATELARANHLANDSVIRVGQRLVLPDADAPSETLRETRGTVKTRERDLGQQTMTVGASVVHYYEPTGPGRKGLRPVIIYLHGRGGSAQADCRRWASVARDLGWLVCPEGPEDRGAGARGWNNTWVSGRRIVMSALDALRAKYGKRVQLFGNTLVGFSEGAYVAMNVGVREPRAFNRWLVLGAHTGYWGALGLEELQKKHERLRKVYLITGQKDQVFEATKQVTAWLRKARVAVKTAAPDVGHRVALDSHAQLYREALSWLSTGR